MKKVIMGLVCTLIAVPGLAGADQWERSNDIVSDTVLNLMWQDNMDVAYARETWENAQAQCKTTELGGFKDWRLPSYDELLSIVNYDHHSPAINPTFQNSGTDYYWTSSSYGSDADSMWVVRFSDGSTNKSYKSYENYVRCVRNK